MSLVPQNHLKLYRVNSAQSQIIFGVSGSSVNTISEISLGSPPQRGSYTGVPVVVVSGGGGSGFVGSAVMGVKAVSITPTLINADFYDPAATQVVLSVSSVEGSGAVLSPEFGAPNIEATADLLFFDPETATSPPGHTLSISGGSGGQIQLGYAIDRISVSYEGGLYSSQPTLTVGGPGASTELRFGFGEVSHSSGFFIVDYSSSCTPPIAAISATEFTDSQASFQHSYRPRLFIPTLVNTPGVWNVSNPIPTISVNPSLPISGSGATYTPKFGIEDVVLVSAGTGYAGGYGVEFKVGSPPTTIVSGTILDDGAGGLDIDSLTLDVGEISSFHPGYFSEVPTVVITDIGDGLGNGDAVLEVNTMRLLRIEATGGTGYTGNDLQLLSQVNSLVETTSPPQLGQSIEGCRLSHAQIYNSTISSEGSGYTWGAELAWGGPGFVTILDGVATGTSSPSISSKKRLKSVIVNSSGTHTSVPSLTLSSSPGPTGASPANPAISIASARLISATTTNRGSGYLKSSTISATGFYSDSGLTSLVSTPFRISSLYLKSASITARGSFYLTGDQVLLNQDQQVGSVSLLEVGSVLILNGGTQFTSAPSVSFSGGNGSPTAAATASISAASFANSSLSILSASDVDLSSPSSGDARKIAQAFAECFYSIFSQEISSVVTATKTISPVFNGVDRRVTYRFDFRVKKPGDYQIKPE